MRHLQQLCCRGAPCENHAIRLVWTHGCSHSVGPLELEALVQHLNVQVQGLCAYAKLDKALQG